MATPGGHYDLISPRYSLEDHTSTSTSPSISPLSIPKREKNEGGGSRDGQGIQTKGERTSLGVESGEFVLAHEIERVLSAGGLDKYMEVFSQEEIDLESFLMLNDTDLRNMSIPTGPRKKILKKIQYLRDKHPNLSSSPGPGTSIRFLYSGSPSSSHPSSLSSSCSPPSSSFSSARTSPANTASFSSSSSPAISSGSLSIPSTTPPPSPIVSPLHFPSSSSSSSHYSTLNEEDRQKGRSLSVDNLGRQEIDPRGAYGRRDHQPIKRFMSESPTSSLLSAAPGAVPLTTPPQLRRASPGPSPGRRAADDGMQTMPPSPGQRKFSLPPLNHHTSSIDRPDEPSLDSEAASASHPLAGRTAGRQRAFALSYLPSKDADVSEPPRKENDGNKAVTFSLQSGAKVQLSSAASYSSVEREKDAVAVDTRLSSSQPNRPYVPRDRIESRILRAKWEIEFDELVLDEKIGSGNFGIVWRAKWRNSPCVVKRLKDKAIQEKLLQEFREESRVWMNIRPHANVVQFLGACSKVPNICIVTEYLPLGDARKLVKSQSIALKSKLQMLLGIAAGMCHLHREGVVHRDLACRNVMVTKNINGEYDAKVGDFGLSRLGEEGIYASSTGEGPLKWMPPEAINPHQRIFSLKSDVWSFGVVVWEILTDGAEPFGNDDAVTAGLRILKGDRLQLPAHTPASLAGLVRDCWRDSDDRRPDFDEICRRMQDICTEACYVDKNPTQQGPSSPSLSAPRPAAFGKTLAELEGTSEDGPRRANEMVELMIKKGIITDSPEKKRQPQTLQQSTPSAWSGGTYGRIGLGNVDTNNSTNGNAPGGAYGRISEDSGRAGIGSYGSISVTPAPAPAPTTAATSGGRDPRRASVSMGAGRALDQTPSLATITKTRSRAGDVSANVINNSGFLGSPRKNNEGGEPMSPGRPRPKSMALSDPENILDWRYQGQHGGVQLSGRLSLRYQIPPIPSDPSSSTENDHDHQQQQPEKIKSPRKTWFAVENRGRGDRESSGMLSGQRRTSVTPSAGYDGAFALLSEREVYLIVHFLDSASLGNLSSASRQWRQLYASPALWRFLFKKRQWAAGVAGMVLRRRRRSTLTKNNEGDELESRYRRQSYEVASGTGTADAELFAHFVTKIATRSLMLETPASSMTGLRTGQVGFNWHRLYVAYFEPWKLPSAAAAAGAVVLGSAGEPVTPRSGGGGGSGRNSREPSVREPITIGQRTVDPLPFKIGMYGMDGVDIATLATSFVDQSLPRSRSGSGRIHPLAASFSMAKLLSQAVLISEALSSLSSSATASVGLTQTHAIQTLGDVSPKAGVQSQQGSYRVESEVDGLRSFFDVHISTYAKDNSRFQKASDREVFCLCYDPTDLHSFFFAISLFYELFDEVDDRDEGGALRIPPLFLVARSSSPAAAHSPSMSSPSDRTVTPREGKMLASILCCPFYALSPPAGSTSIDVDNTRLLFHSIAREARLTREGYSTRFHKADQVPPPSKASASGGGGGGRAHSAPRDGRVIVVKDDLYVGQVGERSQERCGVGVAWMKASRELYMGEWRDDKPHGWGVLYSPREGRRVWSGSWMAGRALSSVVDIALDVAPSSPSASSSSSSSRQQPAGNNNNSRRSK